MKNTIPIHWRKARGTVRYLVYCCIFCCHASHCSDNSSNAGTTEPSNCMIIDALINGASQIAIKEKFFNEPQSIITKYHSQPSVWVHICHIRAFISTNGTGTCINNLYTANIAKVKMIFFINHLFHIISLRFFIILCIITTVLLHIKLYINWIFN